MLGIEKFLFTWFSVLTYFLVLFLLGESYLQYILWGIGTFVGLVVTLKWGQWEYVRKNPLIFLVWILFWSSIVISIFFTRNIPLSLSKIASYGLNITLFMTVLTLPKKVKTSWILLNILFITFAIALMSIFFSFFPQFGQLLPGMNILYATFGHNHLAAILLLVLPISWWFAVTQNEDINFIFPPLFLQFLPFFFSLALLMSFGRVAVLLGLIELVVMYFVLNHNKKNLISKKFVRRQKILGLIFGIILLIKTIFSLISVFRADFVCPLPNVEKQLCKSLTSEVRPFYWEQAIKVIREFPLTGSGPGTFSIASPKHHQAPFLGTSHAHNAFLEAFTDLGIFGGTAFFSLMTLMLIVTGKSTKIKPFLFFFKKNKNETVKEELDWQFPIWLAVISIYVNVLFDYDWNFSGTFTLTLILLALLLRENTPYLEETTQKKLQKQFEKIIFRGAQFGFFLFSALTISLGLIYGIVDFKIFQKDISGAFTFFPYFHWHRKVFEAELPKEYYPQFFGIYDKYPDAYPFFISKEISPEKKSELQQKLFTLDPWQRINNDSTKYYLAQQDWKNSQKEIEELYKLKDISFTKQFDWVFKPKNLNQLATYSLNLADGILLEEPNLAAMFYTKAQEIDEWAWSKHKHKITSIPPEEKTDQQLTFMRNFPYKKAQFLADYKDLYSQKYFQIIKNTLREKPNTLGIDRDLESILSTTNWIAWDSWNALSEIYIKNIEQSLKNKEIIKAQSYVQEWYKVWKVSKKYHSQINYEFEYALAKNLITVCQETIGIQLYVIGQNYNQAQKVIPGILNTEKLWFDSPKHKEKILREETLTYLQQYQELFKGQDYGWRKSEHWELWKDLFETYIENGPSQDFEKAKKMVILLDPIEGWDYIARFNLVKKLQRKIDASIKERELNKEEQDSLAKIIQLMQGIAPKNYWLASARGYFYLRFERIEEAKEAFQTCLDVYSFQENKLHHDCKKGLTDLENNKINVSRYAEISELILNGK